LGGWSPRSGTAVLVGVLVPLNCTISPERTMFPILPGELLTGGLELVCYGFTILAALLSYLLMLR